MVKYYGTLEIKNKKYSAHPAYGWMHAPYLWLHHFYYYYYYYYSYNTYGHVFKCSLWCLLIYKVFTFMTHLKLKRWENNVRTNRERHISIYSSNILFSLSIGASHSARQEELFLGLFMDKNTRPFQPKRFVLNKHISIL